MESAWREDWKPLAWIAVAFAVFYAVPFAEPGVSGAVQEGLLLTQWYAREHVALCVVPALFIAGAIAVLVNQSSVLRLLGGGASVVVAYGVASVSGSVLAVCSCTVLPLFAGIYSRGAGLGPATAFLYSGPAINVLAVVVSARLLGLELGIARTIASVTLAIVVGAAMQLLFRAEERERAAAVLPETGGRPAWQSGTLLAVLLGLLVFANWSGSSESFAAWSAVQRWKWPLTAACAVTAALMLRAWLGVAGWKLLAVGGAVALARVLWPDPPELAFSVGSLGLALTLASSPGEGQAWLAATWDLTRKIVPLLLVGVFLSGLLLGRPEHEGLVPSAWVQTAVGGDGVGATLFASVAGALMYFATLTEIPIVQGLVGAGMGQAPALALLLAGPALSLPSILVLRSIIGWRKTLAYVALVVVLSAFAGLVFARITN